MLTALQARLITELERTTAMLEEGAGIGAGARGRGRAAITSDEAELRARAAHLERLIESLPDVEKGAFPKEGAGFGSSVALVDLDTGVEHDFVLMAGDGVDPDRGEISVASPVGHALLGRRRGDEMAVATPRGTRRFRLRDVTRLDERLATLEDPDPAHVRITDGTGSRAARSDG